MVGGYRDGWEPNESPCPLSRKFRDGVTCGPYRTAEGCHNHQVIAGLREHAVTADRLESELRAKKITLDLRTEERDRLILAVNVLGGVEHFVQCPCCMADRTNGEWHSDDCPMVKED